MDLLPIILKSLQLRKLYCDYSGADTSPISVEDCKSVIEQHTGHKIKIYEVEWPSKHIKGRLFRYKHNSDIFIASRNHITLCEQRYIAVKEMSHIAIDSPSSLTQDILSLINEILQPGTNLIWDNSDALQSEILAEIVAMELLFPWQDREKCIQQMDAGEKNFLEIAKQYMIPLDSMLWIIGRDVHETLKQTHETLYKALGTLDKK